MAVMRKMPRVAYQLLKTKQTYDPIRVFAQSVNHKLGPLLLLSSLREEITENPNVCDSYDCASEQHEDIS